MGSSSEHTTPPPLYRGANHPFYPPSLVFPDYRENTLHPIYLLAIFFGILGTWLFVAHKLARSTSKNTITTRESLWVAWFAASGAIHITFEG